MRRDIACALAWSAVSLGVILGIALCTIVLLALSGAVVHQLPAAAQDLLVNLTMFILPAALGLTGFVALGRRARTRGVRRWATAAPLYLVLAGLTLAMLEGDRHPGFWLFGGGLIAPWLAALGGIIGERLGGRGGISAAHSAPPPQRTV